MERNDGKERREQKLLSRDISRFETLYPNGEAQLKENATPGFAYLNSAEMVALTRT